MPFWKKSDDPWDRKPDKALQPKEEKANLLDSLDAWNEDRKARAKEKEEAKRLPPEKCPWCGKDMEQGFMTGGRDSAAYWYSGVYKFNPLRGLGTADMIDVLDEGGAWEGCYKTIWLCRDCKKMVFDVTDALEHREPLTAQPNTEETKKEETSEE